MNLRHALHEQAIQHGLDAASLSRLYKLARLTTEPERLMEVGLRACAIAGGALVGMAGIMWVAANWTSFGRYGRLLLAETFVIIPLLLIVWRPQWRLPLAVMALLGIGALFACLGQTYQTGADPWQLFALWAVLALPLCLGVRHEVIWLPWVIIATTALTLLQSMELPDGWFRRSAGFELTEFAIWGIAAALTLCCRLPLFGKLGVGKWSAGFALLSTVSLIAYPTLHDLLYGRYIFFWPALVILAGAAAMFATRAYFDVLGLCLTLLTADVVLCLGFFMLLPNGNSIDLWIFHFVLTATVAAAALIGSGHIVLKSIKQEGAAS